MRTSRRLTTLGVLWAVGSAVVLVLAATRVIEWGWVWLFMIGNGVASGARWWSDRRARFLTTMRVAQEQQAESDHTDGGPAPQPTQF